MAHLLAELLVLCVRFGSPRREWSDRLVMRRVLASPEFAEVGPGGLAVEREFTDGDEAVMFKHLARGRIVQRDSRAQPAESVLGGGEFAHLAHRRCGQSLPRGLLRDPVSQL